MARYTVPYTLFPSAPCEAFPQRSQAARPVLPGILKNGTLEWPCYAIVDSGADDCVFPRSFGTRIGLHMGSGRHYPLIGVGSGPGTVDAARHFLKGLNLKEFSRHSRASFEVALGDLTDALEAALPREARRWGSSRKFLNIVLRDVLYNRYLCARYDLDRLEPWLEVPLDSQVAKGLRREKGSEVLPRWHTVIGISPGKNRIFQDFAEKVASSQGTYRVHLDLLYWRGLYVFAKSPQQRDKSLS